MSCISLDYSINSESANSVVIYKCFFFCKYKILFGFSIFKYFSFLTFRIDLEHGIVMLSLMLLDQSNP